MTLDMVININMLIVNTTVNSQSMKSLINKLVLKFRTSVL